MKTRLVPFTMRFGGGKAAMVKTLSGWPEDTPPPKATERAAPTDPAVLAIVGARRVVEGRAGSPYEAALGLVEPDSPVTVGELADAILSQVVEIEKRPGRPPGNPGAQADALLRGLVDHAKQLVVSGDCESVAEAVKTTLEGLWGRNAAMRWEGLAGATMDSEGLAALVVASLQ